MRSRSLTYLLTFAICSLALASDGPSDTNAIVTIWTNLRDGHRAFGTGFLTSPDGQVTTAYHVIQRARGIQVLHQGNGYSNILVESISPEHDLARLKIVGLSQAVPYLRLVFKLPRGIQNNELFVFGHGGGISNQRLVARMIRPEPILSSEIRGRRLERLFHLDDVRLLPLQTTIYNGISGGPVLSQHGVIGILSGSIEEGGTIAWAIPAEYAQPSKMRVVNKSARDIKNWPELTLMVRNWKNLRKSVFMTEGLSQAIERYFLAVDDLAVIHEKLPLLFLDAKTSSQMLRMYIEQRPDASLDEILDPNSYLVQKWLTANLTLSEALTKERPPAHLQVSYCLNDIIPAVSNLFKNDIPRTQKNYRIKTELIESIRSISAEGFELKTLGVGDQKAMEMAGLLGQTPESKADLLAILDAYEEIATVGTKPEVIMELDALIRQFRRVGHVVESLLVADFEGESENWSFTSEHGYEILMPSGWEFAARGDDERFREDAEAARKRGIILEALFINRFGSELGSQSTVVLQSGIIPDMFIPAITDEIVSAFAQGYRRSFPDAQFYRQTIGEKPMLVGKATLQRDGEQWIDYFAFIPYKEDSFWLSFRIPANRAEYLLPQCKSVLERISIK